MNSKIFIVLLINAFWALMPQNIIGCADGPDPKDYYTSFFSNAHITDNSYRPFFYSAITKFYDDFDWYSEDEPVEKKAPDALIAEWQQYAGKDIPAKQVKAFVYEATPAVVQYLLDIAEGKKSAKPAEYDSFTNNPMAKAMFSAGKKEAMQYLLFAKQVQQIAYTVDPWEEPVHKDSAKLMGWYKKAEILRQQVKDPFVQNKYAFMQCRIAFYAGNYPLCIRMVDSFYGSSGTSSAVKPMAVGYKAGSFFKMGKKEEAALWFARVFQMTPENRKQNFLSFYWSTDNGKASVLPKIMAKAADNKEKALIAGLFAIHGLEYGLENMKQVYNLDSQCDLLPMLTIREIKKLEENYLSPKLGAQKGTGEIFYQEGTAPGKEHLLHAEKVLSFLEQLSADKTLPQNDLYRLGAAYIAYFTGKNDKAFQWAGEIFNNPKAGSAKQQALLIRLLASIGETQGLNSAKEAELLPMLQSLYSTAEAEIEYRIFLRNIFSQVLAPKYFAQKDIHKTALCLGVANLARMPELKDADQYYFYNGRNGIDYVRNELSTSQVVQLHDFMKSKSLSPYEKFLVEKTSFDKDEVADFIGTSYLRDHNWKQAIEWLGKADQKELLIGYAYNQNSYEYDSVNVNPFYDYINDWQRYERPLSRPMNKLELARKIESLEYQYDTTANKALKGKLAYSLGAVYYNLSYYGNSWMALDYYRSTVLWNNGKYTGWRKEYFELNKARKYFQSAYELSTANKEFQAACFFLVAKCAQRQIPRQDFDYGSWESAEKAEKVFQRKFGIIHFSLSLKWNSDKRGITNMPCRGAVTLLILTKEIRMMV